tara:strand:- start:5117 stop:5881 length:765 start_codon:yes stop_codon:yes gene_type:complete
MIHLITLAGNSLRFKRQNLGHKALCQIKGKAALHHLVKHFDDFNNFETIFLCKNEDLAGTDLRDQILSSCKGAHIHGIERNDLGPVYSISRIFDKLPDHLPILVTYVDTIQRTSLAQIEADFKGYEGGISVHDFKNPHWDNNKSYCLVRHDPDLVATTIVEKFDFSQFDFKEPLAAGSSGSYYFASGSILKSYFNKVLEEKNTINGEYYVTQPLCDMVKDGMKVKCGYYPFVSLGSPGDLSDYEFWLEWFNCDE